MYEAWHAYVAEWLMSGGIRYGEEKIGQLMGGRRVKVGVPLMDGQTAWKARRLPATRCNNVIVKMSKAQLLLGFSGSSSSPQGDGITVVCSVFLLTLSWIH